MASLTNLADNGGRPFEFEPLPHPLTHIRVLEILPIFSEEDLTIRCRLKVVRLLDHSQCYTALSYVWGSQHERLPIVVNGLVFNIGRNLYDFFIIYRERLMDHSLPTVFLWVDAICIDHLNIGEKNAQVQIMANIYQRAKVVFAWLQPFSQDNHLENGTSNMGSVIKLFVEAEKDIKKPQNYHNNQYLASQYHPSLSESSVPNLSKHWRSLLRLCQHDFWHRRWIVSELFHATELVFMFGQMTFSLSEWRAPFILLWAMIRLGIYVPLELQQDSFEAASIFATPASRVLLSRLILEDEASIPMEGATGGTYAVFSTERWHLTNEREALPLLLEKYDNWQCSEAVDRIYSILNLSNSQLTVDYDRNNIELFCAVVLSLKAQAEVSNLCLLGKTLDIATFIKSCEDEQGETKDLTMQNCKIQKAYLVKPIRVRNELADVINARVGTNKTSYYRFAAQQSLDKMRDWTDFPTSNIMSTQMPRAGTPMRIVDGFDISELNFRPALFLNGGKALLGIASTDYIQDGDILCTENSMNVAIVLRISGLSKTWLTVVGFVIFARQIGVHGEFSAIPSIRSASLNDFCEHAQPTPFTIVTPWSKEYMKLRPHNIQLRGLFKEARPTSSLARRFGNRADRVERWLDVVSPHRRSSSSGSR